MREEHRIAETLNRIGGILAAELDLKKLVQAVTDEATRITDAAFGAFFYNVRNGQGESYTLYTTSGVPREESKRSRCPATPPSLHRPSTVRAWCDWPT